MTTCSRVKWYEKKTFNHASGISSHLKMKKWTGGILIVVLAMILVIRYSFMETRPQKQSAYDFFNGDSKNVAESEDNDSNKFEVPESPYDSFNKPHLVTVEGLDDLYSMANISEDVLKITRLWGQMHDLMSRSDSLPGTARGVREASIAWKEILEILEKEKAPGAVNSTINHVKEQDCPFTLSILNLTSSINETLLEFPCGLVEGSSITVVGIPFGDFGTFQFKLAGAQFPGEQEPPIILHYNVSLQSGTSTDGPIIVQNSWTAEQSWGQEEKCPTYGSPSIHNACHLLGYLKFMEPNIALEMLNKYMKVSFITNVVQCGEKHPQPVMSLMDPERDP